ncbi:hypothetical protein V6N12_057552 [Hibiscus sabdariffa]|uniref:Uncharacterized protein n=1 Tax=Hibiscus sabdariffa TaxID=183260 RepID=A0ABR2C5G2_9ROSI
MEVFNSIVGSIASKVAEYNVDLAARQLGYLFKHKSKFLNEMVQRSVDAANRNGEVIFDWLTAVDEKISEEAATQLQEDEEKAMKMCFSRFCPDFKSRYLLSKKVDKESDAITQLLAKKDEFNTISYLPAVEAIDIIRPVREYESFESRSGAFDELMVALKDDTTSIIGVYGMGGLKLDNDPSIDVRAAWLRSTEESQEGSCHLG